MKNQLKKGQVFRVFEITENNPYSPTVTGKWFAESKNDFYGSKNGVDCPIQLHGVYLHLGINDSRKQAKKVGRLRITKLK